MIDKYLLEGEKKADPDLEVADSPESLAAQPVREQRSKFKAALTRWLGAAGVALSALVASGCGNVDNHQESSAKTDTRDRTADTGKTEQALSSNPRFLGVDCMQPILNPDDDEIACCQRSFGKCDSKIIKFAGKDYMKDSFTVTTWTPPKPSLSGEGFSTIFKRKGINNAIELFGIDYGGGGALVKWENNNWIDVHWDTNHAGPNSVAQFDNDTLVVGGDIGAKIDIARINLNNQTGVPYKLVPITGIEKILKEPVMFYPYRKLSEGFARTTLDTVHYVKESAPGTWYVTSPPFIPPKDTYSFDFKKEGCWIVVGTWNTTTYARDVVIDQMPNCPLPPSENPATENMGGEPVAEGVDGGANETTAEVSNEATVEVINDAADGGTRDQQDGATTPDGAPDWNQADGGNKDNGGSDTFEPVTADGGNADNEPASTDGPSTEKNIDGGQTDNTLPDRSNSDNFHPDTLGTDDKTTDNGGPDNNVNNDSSATPDDGGVQDSPDAQPDKVDKTLKGVLECGDTSAGRIRPIDGEPAPQAECKGNAILVKNSGSFEYNYLRNSWWAKVTIEEIDGCAKLVIPIGGNMGMACGEKTFDSRGGDGFSTFHGTYDEKEKRVYGLWLGYEGTKAVTRLNVPIKDGETIENTKAEFSTRITSDKDPDGKQTSVRAYFGMLNDKGQYVQVDLGRMTKDCSQFKEKNCSSFIENDFKTLVAQAKQIGNIEPSERPAPDIDPNKPGCGGCSTNPNEDGGNNTPSWPLAALGALGLAALRRRKAGRNREKKDGK